MKQLATQEESNKYLTVEGYTYFLSDIVLLREPEIKKLGINDIFTSDELKHDIIDSFYKIGASKEFVNDLIKFNKKNGKLDKRVLNIIEEFYNELS